MHYGYMDRTIRRTLVAAAAVCAASFLLVSCASLQRSADSGVVRRVADLINAGDSRKIAALSAIPFLVDGEVVVLPADVASFWSDAAKAGFKVDGAALDAGTVVGADSYRQFADTMEVKAFFTRYVPGGSRVLAMTTASGSHVLLIVHSGFFSTKLYGFKGPF
jgi:hypothetical protein